jgi:hypothetical protein
VDTAEEELKRTRTLFENKMAEFQVKFTTTTTTKQRGLDLD